MQYDVCCFGWKYYFRCGLIKTVIYSKHAESCLFLSVLGKEWKRWSCFIDEPFATVKDLLIESVIQYDRQYPYKYCYDRTVQNRWLIIFCHCAAIGNEQHTMDAGSERLENARGERAGRYTARRIFWSPNRSPTDLQISGIHIFHFRLESDCRCGAGRGIINISSSLLRNERKRHLHLRGEKIGRRQGTTEKERPSSLPSSRPSSRPSSSPW